MKTKTLFTAMLLVFAISSTKGQKSFQQSTYVPGDYSHWSIAVGGGLDYYRVMPFAGHNTARYSNFWDFYFDEGGVQMFNPQISVEYTVNQLYGFGVHFGRFGYDRIFRDEMWYGRTCDFTVYGSVDLLDLVDPCRPPFWQKLSIYGDVGMGLGFYRGHMPETAFNDMINTDEVAVSSNRYKGTTPVFTTFLNPEYSLGRRFSLGLGFGYRWYMRHNMGGQWSGGMDEWSGEAFEPMNNDGWNLTLSLRLKLGNGKRKHIRDVHLCGSDASYLDLLARIDAIEQNCCSPNAVVPVVAATATSPCPPPVVNVYNYCDGTVTTSTVGTTQPIGSKVPLGIPANPDDPNAVVGAYIPALPVTAGEAYPQRPVYDKQGPATGILAGIPGVTGDGTPESPWRIHNVNFVFDKTVLIDSSKQIISQVLRALLTHYDEWHILKIDGHTDWMGTDAYNEGLANRRAAAIKKYFIDNGLGQKVFVTEGFGEKRPIAPNANPDGSDDPVGRQENRRVELYIIR
ncbi:MAG: OmpA family protein [Dysgonamonadaceae bacterium]|nr:OmpA family protein [Dysgonamonadaceae bacterium]